MPEFKFETNNQKGDSIKVFVLEDPSLHISKRIFGSQLLLDIEYEFNTELLYAFSYETINGERHYYAHYINAEIDKKEIEVDSDLANIRIKDGVFIYNGSYYKSII